MKRPIFVVASDSTVHVFADVARAARSMEAVDVLEGEYEVFDADGLRLDAQAVADDSPVVIRELTGRHPEPDELRRLLRVHVRAVQGVRPELVEVGPEGLDDLDLPGLVAVMETMERRLQEGTRMARLRRRLCGMGRRIARR